MNEQESHELEQRLEEMPTDVIAAEMMAMRGELQRATAERDALAAQVAALREAATPFCRALEDGLKEAATARLFGSDSAWCYTDVNVGDCGLIRAEFDALHDAVTGATDAAQAHEARIREPLEARIKELEAALAASGAEQPQFTKYLFRYADGRRATVTTTSAPDPWALSRLVAQAAGIEAETSGWEVKP